MNADLTPLYAFAVLLVAIVAGMQFSEAWAVNAARPFPAPQIRLKSSSHCSAFFCSVKANQFCKVKARTPNGFSNLEKEAPRMLKSQAV
jgi:hypothetical protein